MEEGNDRSENSVNGESSENNMEIDDVSPPNIKNCFQILNELSHKFDIGKPLYGPCEKKGSRNWLQLELNHLNTSNLTTTRFSGIQQNFFVD
jgi:hypothetical protein